MSVGDSACVVVGEAVSVPDTDAGGDANAAAIPVGLAAGKSEAEPLAVAPTQPAATNAVSDTRALNLRPRLLLTNLDSTACPSRRPSMRERVCDAMVEGRVMGPPDMESAKGTIQRRHLRLVGVLDAAPSSGTSIGAFNRRVTAPF